MKLKKILFLLIENRIVISCNHILFSKIAPHSDYTVGKRYKFKKMMLNYLNLRLKNEHCLFFSNKIIKLRKN